MTMILTKTRADDFTLRGATLAAFFGRWDSGIDYDECGPDAIAFLRAADELERLMEAGAVATQPRAVIEALAEKHCLDRIVKLSRGKRRVEGFDFSRCSSSYWNWVPLP